MSVMRPLCASRRHAAASRAWAYRALGWTTAVSYIRTDNARSARLAERLGITAELDDAPSLALGVSEVTLFDIDISSGDVMPAAEVVAWLESGMPEAGRGPTAPGGRDA